jgi:sulfur transfer complex TusBCD TusB component (DsrH family)
LEAVVQSLFGRFARQLSSALLCAGAVFAAGCHHNNQTSGYGVAWVTLSDTPGDFTSYIVNVDAVTLTGQVNGVVTAVSAAETVDFTKLKDISELWSAASIPNDTYTSATITLDYSLANISVMVNGVPTKATVVDTTGAKVTTQTVNITFDPAHRLVITPTYASTNAERLAIDFDLAASNVVNMATTTPTVTIKPFMTIATSAADTKLVRVRGPLINSSVGISTYTVYVRPFFDEVNSLGSLTIFNDANTIYTINGTAYTGTPGLTVLSQSSAGTTQTAAYTTYEPTATPGTTAGKFNSSYVVAGSTLEDYYTEGLEGDVISRSGNTLTVRGSTLQLNNGTSQYNNGDAVVLIGPATIVTVDDNTTLKGLNYKSIAVGQHIIARGLYSLPASQVVTLDATGASATNTGSVRLQSTELWGPVVATTSGGLLLNLQTIENWPVSVFNFAGNGAGALTPSSYLVNTSGATVPAGLAAGDPLWVAGLAAPFGSAPPDFNAFTVNTEVSAPATLRVDWTSAGTTSPFAQLTDAGIVIALTNPEYSAGVIRIGSESIELTALAASPLIVPQPPPAATAVPAVFLPRFAIGSLTAANTTTIAVYNTFSDYVTQLPKSLVAATPALHFVATGVFNRSSNTFTATSIDVVN